MTKKTIKISSNALSTIGIILIMVGINFIDKHVWRGVAGFICYMVGFMLVMYVSHYSNICLEIGLWKTKIENEVEEKGKEKQ